MTPAAEVEPQSAHFTNASLAHEAPKRHLLHAAAERLIERKDRDAVVTLVVGQAREGDEVVAGAG